MASEVALGSAIDRLSSKLLSPVFLVGLLRIFDLSVVAVCGAATYFILGFPVAPSFQAGYAATILIGVILVGALAQWFGVYKEDYLFSRLPRVDRVLGAWFATVSALLLMAFALQITGSFSRSWAVTWFLSTGGLLLVGRLSLAWWMLTCAREGRFAERTIILGAGEQGQRLAAHMRQRNDLRTSLVGFIDDRIERVPHAAQGLDVLGNIDHLVQLIRRGAVDQVFVALPWSAHARIAGLVRRLAMTPVHIRLAPDLAAFEFIDRSCSQVAGLPMLHLFDRPLSGWAQVSKSIEDRVLAGLGLLFVGPLLLLIALAVKLDSRGPVFFKQNRYGFNNNLIKVWKFRTMHSHLADADCRVQTTRNDPRVTRVGDFLRRTSLDELPQLVNVLKGDMSIVGPRPHAAATKAAGRLFEEVVDQYAARHRVKPGITGWAQVNGWRGETDTVEKIRKRVEYDLFYIDNWSVWFDVVVIAQTFMVLFNHKNAY